MGRNIRTADLPLPCTKRMAHHFLQAPDHLTVKEALAAGAGPRTRRVEGPGPCGGLNPVGADVRVGRLLGHCRPLFVNHPELDPAQIGPVIDYLYHQKYVPEEVAIEGGALVDLGPPQPDLAMKGRTPRSLLRQVNDWKNRPTFARKFSSRRKLELAKWEPSGIEPFRQVNQDGPAGSRCWTIRELTSVKSFTRGGRDAPLRRQLQEGMCGSEDFHLVHAVPKRRRQFRVTDDRGEPNYPNHLPGQPSVQLPLQTKRPWA